MALLEKWSFCLVLMNTVSLNGPVLTTVKACIISFYLQNRIPGAVTLLVSPRCHAYTFISNNDRFVLSPWLIISLAPCCERGPAYSQLVSDMAVMFLSLHMFGLWELSWILQTPDRRRVNTYLIATWFAHSFLSDLDEVWAENTEFKVQRLKYLFGR